ncbi:MAG: hypothetical protein J2P36_31020 [Ktedonobacteraceae bacterium]|nr:hypothetical protein [Ktedonobacteraceae bacterium]
MGKSTQTALGYLLHQREKTSELVWLKDLERQCGVYVNGLQGKGKSTFLLTILLQDLKKGAPVIVIDPHEDLNRYLIATMPEERISDIRWFNLREQQKNPFVLNLFACRNPCDLSEREHVRNRAIQIFEKLWPEIATQPAVKKMLRNLIEVLIDHPEMTLADIPALLSDRRCLIQRKRRVHDCLIRSYWQADDGITREDARRLLEDRFDELLSDEVVRRTICSRASTFDAAESIIKGEVLLFSLPVNDPIWQQSARIIGTILISLITSATFSLGQIEMQKRSHFTFVIDEFHYFATIENDIAALFAQGRKFGCRMMIANQYRQQIQDTSTKEATLTASTMVTFAAHPSDAKELAPLFHESAPRLMNLGKREALLRLGNGKNGKQTRAAVVTLNAPPSSDSATVEKRKQQIWAQTIATYGEELGERLKEKTNIT